MFDSLVLVKKYRPCLGGYTLEFPTSNVADNENGARDQDAVIVNNVNPNDLDHLNLNKSLENHSTELGCGKTKMVSVYLDGDDPIYQNQHGAPAGSNGLNLGCDGGEIVYVPVNGLLDRLNNYDRQGISIDSRVYAFAMGLKTSERFLTSSCEKEIQEAPPL